MINHEILKIIEIQTHRDREVMGPDQESNHSRETIDPSISTQGSRTMRPSENRYTVAKRVHLRAQPYGRARRRIASSSSC